MTMSEKIMLGDFIYKMRKEKNLSQAELGRLVGVSNKAVSKWETYEANPDLGIVKRLAQVLGVTADELLACEKSRPEEAENNEGNLLGIRGTVISTETSYEFVSRKKTRKGTPYVHICLGKDERGRTKKAKGIIAVGAVAQGLVSLGFVSIGLVSLGIISIGFIALGMLSFGLLAAVGGINVALGAAVGGIAVGTVAVGGISVGVLSVGGIAVGVWAHTGEFGKAIGLYTYFHPMAFPTPVVDTDMFFLR